MIDRKPSSWILLLLVSFPTVLAMLVTPALPAISDKLNISNVLAQLTMTLFLIGYAFGNLIYGPISNRFGRKPAIYLGISIALFSNLIIILAASLKITGLFMFGRFLSALGSCVGMKIYYTIIADVYKGSDVTKKISMAMMAFAVAPAIAVFVGGYLTDQFGSDSCFYFLAGYSLLLLILSFSLPETCPELNPQALNLKKISEAYVKKLKKIPLVYCAIIMGLATSIIYLFATLAPFIAIDYIKIKANQYGYFNLIPQAGMLIGAVLALGMAKKKDSHSVLLWGIMLSIFFSGILLILFGLNIISVWSLFLPVALLFIAQSLIFTNASAIALSYAENKSIASALINFINMMMSVFVLLLAGAFSPTILYTMPLLFVILSLLMVCIQIRLHKLQRSSSEVS